MKAKTKAAEALRTNLRVLAERAKQDRDLTSRGNGQFTPKTLNNVVNGRHAPTLETLQKIADAFGIEVWQLLLPEFHAGLLLDPQIGRVMRAYATADEEGREMFTRTASLIERSRRAANE